MKHGRDVWMNPAEPGVQDRTRAVILDVVRRYDIDGCIWMIIFILIR